MTAYEPSAKAYRHRHRQRMEALEAKRLDIIDGLAGKDDDERARLSEMTYGQLVCEKYRLPPQLPLAPEPDKPKEEA